MKIVIDLLTPKQCLFFQKLSENLKDRNHEVFLTSRNYREVNELLESKGIDSTKVGSHGGKTLIGKLKASATRISELSSLLNEIHPDIAVSFSSPEMARVSFGLGVPHICVNDSPHAIAVARLTVPLSERLLTPKMIPKRHWLDYGIQPQKVVQYNALDPWVWIRDFEPKKKVLDILDLDSEKPIITFRTEESFAAYLLDKSIKESTVVPVVNGLLKRDKEIQIVIVPRYMEQIDILKRTLRNKVIICESVIDGPSLLYYSSVFVGAGGTMTIESALLGIPTISCYPGNPFILEEYLVEKKIIVREREPKTIVNRILSQLEDIEKIKKRQLEKSRRLTSRFEDPLEIITREIETVGET